MQLPQPKQLLASKIWCERLRVLPYVAKEGGGKAKKHSGGKEFWSSERKTTHREHPLLSGERNETNWRTEKYRRRPRKREYTSPESIFPLYADYSRAKKSGRRKKKRTDLERKEVGLKQRSTSRANRSERVQQNRSRAEYCHRENKETRCW